MDRQQALATDRTWSGFVRTEPGMVSSWHHGEYETVIYRPDRSTDDEIRSERIEHRGGGSRRFRIRPERRPAPREQPFAEPADE
jgi:hypothetical protein